jgi:hypothetical protein
MDWASFPRVFDCAQRNRCAINIPVPKVIGDKRSRAARLSIGPVFGNTSFVLLGSIVEETAPAELSNPDEA